MDAIVAARSTYVFDGFRLDRYERQLLRLDEGGALRPVPLGSRALDILCVILAHDGTLVSKAGIMDAVWPGLAVEENNLTVQVSALRRALDAGRAGPSLIQTVPGRGYRFAGKLLDDSEAFELGPASLSAGDADAPADPGPDTPVRPGTLPWRWRGSVVAALVAAGVAMVAWFAAPSSRDLPRLSVLVLPFAGNGAERDAELAGSVAESLTAQLVALPGSFVIGPQTAAGVSAEGRDAPHLARALEVRYVVGGTLRRFGDELRVSPHVTDTATGAQMRVPWFTTTVADPAEARRRILRNIGASISTALLDAEARRLKAVPANRLTSADLLLQVESGIRHVVGPDQNKHLVALLERALVLDPNSSRAMILLANLLMRPSIQWDVAGMATAPLQRAKLLVDDARRIAPGRTSLLMAQALLLRIEQRWAEAAAAYRQLLERDPDSVILLNQVAVCEIALGHADLAVPLLREALGRFADDPQAHLAEFNLGRALVFLGQDAEALHWLRRTRQDHPFSPAALNAFMAAALARLGRLDEAQAEVAAFVARRPGVTLSLLRHSPVPNQAADAAQERFVGGLALAGLRETLGGASVGDPSGPAATDLPRVDTPALQEMLRGATLPVILVAGPDADIKIRGAVTLPGSMSGAELDAQARKAMRAWLDRLTQGDPERPVVITAWNAGSRRACDLGVQLVSLGYRNVACYPGGTEAWHAAELPVEASFKRLAQVTAVAAEAH